MATERQIAANRANAQKSTGPRTPRGRAAVRLNSVTHGLTAQSILTYGEENEIAQLQAVRAALEAEWQPQTVTETLLLDEASACWWRLRRGRAAEDFCTAVAFKHLAYEHDDFALINIENHCSHTPTKIEIVGTAFRDTITAQQMTRVSLYNGRNFRQMYRCFQQIIQLRKQSPIDTADLEEAADAQPQPESPQPPEPPVKTTDALLHDLWYSPKAERLKAEQANRKAEAEPQPDPIPPGVAAESVPNQAPLRLPIRIHEFDPPSEPPAPLPARVNSQPVNPQPVDTPSS